MNFLYDVSVLSMSILIVVIILYGFDRACEKIVGWADGK